jgi:hypothetical protein
MSDLFDLLVGAVLLGGVVVCAFGALSMLDCIVGTELLCWVKK